MDLEAVRTELYGLSPDQFTATRETKVKQARGEGDRALATEIGRLRKPTVSAWLVNLLARQRRRPLDELLSLGTDLRAAQAALAGDDLRRLAAERQRRVSALVDGARGLAAEQGHSPSGPVEDEVTATLEAAVADPDAAAAVRSGSLVSALRHSGFGWGDLPAGGADRHLTAVPAPKPATGAVGRQRGKPGAEAAAAARAARRAAEQARDEAQKQAQRAEAEAAAALDRQEAATALVVDLEGQLDRARQAATAAAAEVKAAGRSVRAAGRRAEQAQHAVDRLG